MFSTALIRSKLNLNRIILCFNTSIFLAFSGLAYSGQEDVLSIGPSAKSHGGAGLLWSRGSEGGFHNPAAIAAIENDQLDFEISIFSLNYSYEYPGESAVSIEKFSPIPYFGAAKHLHDQWYFSGSVLLYPGTAEKVEIKSLPSREAGETPILIDISQKGPKWAGLISFGLANRLTESQSIGLSVIGQRKGHERTAHDVETGLKLQEESLSQDSIEWLLGYSYRSEKWQIDLRIMPYGSVHQKRSTETLSVFGDGSESVDERQKRPLQVGLGLKREWSRWGIFAEWSRAQWSKVSSTQSTNFDYFDTTHSYYGFMYKWQNDTSLHFTFGILPTHLGDGLMGSRSENGETTEGIQTGQLSGINRNVWALSWQSLSHNFYIQHQSGRREVFEASPHYGDHTLNIFLIGYGGHHSF